MRWKPIKENSDYLISCDGRVMSLKKQGAPIIKKQCLNKSGYLVTGISRNDKQKLRTIHRLVALNFIPNPENKREVNHIDGIKTNNHVWNLEWCTHKENMHHAIKTGLMENVYKSIDNKGSKNGMSKLNEEKVLEIRERLSNGETKNTLALEFEVSSWTILMVENRTQWKHI